MRFEELNLIQPLLKAVEEQGYLKPTPIQQQAIPEVLAGRDMFGLARTGTGKTAAFALPTLQTLSERQGGSKKRRKGIKALVLTPTRELAVQIGESFDRYGKHTSIRHTTVFGGVNQKRQVAAINQGMDIVIATPGRLLDLHGQGHIHLGRIEILILDEADRMLDMGFMPDVRRIIDLTPTENRQTLLFSATMPPDIKKLAADILQDPITVEVEPESTTVEAISQQVYFVETADKRKLLTHLLKSENMFRTLVFTRTKHGADRVVKHLSKAKIEAEAIHGDKSQNARQRALTNFKRGKTHVLVATDIASRGIDVDDISHVVNFDLPSEAESYVHRIGRTGRAGAEGIAISFCEESERKYLARIERLIQLHLTVVEDQPYASTLGTPRPTDLTHKRAAGDSDKKKSNNSRRNRRRRSNNDNNGNRHTGQNTGNSRNGNRSAKATRSNKGKAKAEALPQDEQSRVERAYAAQEEALRKEEERRQRLPSSKWLR